MSAHDRRPPYYLGIDLGGTNIKSGVVDDVGEPLSSVSLETEADRGPEVGIAKLAEAGRRAVSASGLSWDRITGVGLGSPGTMDLSRGMLLEPPNLPGWNHLPIRDLLAKKLEKQTVLQNDANAAAYGEYWAGGAEHSQPRTLHAGHGNRLRNRRRGPDHRGPAQPRWRVRPHHHPDGERPSMLVRRLRAPRGLCLGHRPCEAGRRGTRP